MTKVVVVRITNDPQRLNGSATVVFPGICVQLYGDSGAGFVYLVEEELISNLTKESQASNNAGWNRGSEEGAGMWQADIDAAYQPNLTPQQLLNDYEIYGAQTFNEVNISGEKPVAIFYNNKLECAENLQKFLKIYPELPILKYQKGLFFNQENEVYDFGDVLTAQSNINDRQPRYFDNTLDQRPHELPPQDDSQTSSPEEKTIPYENPPAVFTNQHDKEITKSKKLNPFSSCLPKTIFRPTPERPNPLKSKRCDEYNSFYE